MSDEKCEHPGTFRLACRDPDMPLRASCCASSVGQRYLLQARLHLGRGDTPYSKFNSLPAMLHPWEVRRNSRIHTLRFQVQRSTAWKSAPAYLFWHKPPFRSHPWRSDCYIGMTAIFCVRAIVSTGFDDSVKNAWVTLRKRSPTDRLHLNTHPTASLLRSAKHIPTISAKAFLDSKPTRPE